MNVNPNEKPSLADLMHGAASTRELYLAYLEAGFTELQAMQMICTILSGMAHVMAEAQIRG